MIERAADELDARDDGRLGRGEGDAQLGEEARHLREVVQLAPAGPEEDGPEREANGERPDPREAVEDGEDRGYGGRRGSRGTPEGAVKIRLAPPGGYRGRSGRGVAIARSVTQGRATALDFEGLRGPARASPGRSSARRRQSRPRPTSGAPRRLHRPPRAGLPRVSSSSSWSGPGASHSMPVLASTRQTTSTPALATGGVPSWAQSTTSHPTPHQPRRRREREAELAPSPSLPRHPCTEPSRHRRARPPPRRARRRRGPPATEPPCRRDAPGVSRRGPRPDRRAMDWWMGEGGGGPRPAHRSPPRPAPPRAGGTRAAAPRAAG